MTQCKFVASLTPARNQNNLEKRKRLFAASNTTLYEKPGHHWEEGMPLQRAKLYGTMAEKGKVLASSSRKGGQIT